MKKSLRARKKLRKLRNFSRKTINICKRSYSTEYSREAYKFYSAVAPVGFICSIGTNVFSDIVSNFEGFVDNTTFKISDLDLEFVATNAGVKKNNPRNPDRQLVRHQIMEVLVRLAIDKYIKSGQTKSFSEAVYLSFSNYFLRFFKGFDCHRFRRERLWNEPCDIIFKRFFKVVTALYARYSGKYALPG